MLKVVQNDSAVPAGLYGEYLQQHQLPWELAPLDQGAAFPQPAAGDHLILLGGYMSVDDMTEYPYLDQVQQGLQRWVKAARPVLGICLGGQQLAAATGGKVTRNHLGERGLLPIDLTEAGLADPLFAGLENPFRSVQWHNDSFELPARAVHLASTAVCPGQAFRVGKTAYGVQFHPELTAEIVAVWSHKLRLGDAYLDEFLSAQGVYRQASLQLLQNFLQLE